MNVFLKQSQKLQKSGLLDDKKIRGIEMPPDSPDYGIKTFPKVIELFMENGTMNASLLFLSSILSSFMLYGFREFS